MIELALLLTVVLVSAVAAKARNTFENRRYRRTLLNICNLEAELGLLDGVVDTTEDVERERALAKKTEWMEDKPLYRLSRSWKKDPKGGLVAGDLKAPMHHFCSTAWSPGFTIPVTDHDDVRVVPANYTQIQRAAIEHRRALERKSFGL